MVSSKAKVNLSLSLSVLIIGLGALSAYASDGNSRYIEACKSELQQYYGDQVDITLISKRRSSSGVQVKLAARTDRDNSEFVNCWVPNYDTGGSNFNGAFNTAAIPAATQIPGLD
jgi:hypothetical protein